MTHQQIDAFIQPYVAYQQSLRTTTPYMAPPAAPPQAHVGSFIRLVMPMAQGYTWPAKIFHAAILENFTAMPLPVLWQLHECSLLDLAYLLSHIQHEREALSV